MALDTISGTVAGGGIGVGGCDVATAGDEIQADVTSENASYGLATHIAKMVWKATELHFK